MNKLSIPQRKKKNRYSWRSRLIFIFSFTLVFGTMFGQLGHWNVAHAQQNYNLGTPYLTDTTVLSNQIVWADFAAGGNGNATYTNVNTVNGKPALKVGTILTINVTDDYVVTAEVTALKPFDASAEYQARVAGTGDEASYRPNATNTNQGKNQGRSILIGQQSYPPATNWSNINQAGFDLGTGLVCFTPHYPSVNAGVTLQLSATYKGQPVDPPDVVMADSEEASSEESFNLVTGGMPWELIANVANLNLENLQPIKVTGANDLASLQGSGYLPQYWASPDQVNGGLNSQVFGPVATQFESWPPGGYMDARYGVPIVMSRQTDEVSFYINSAGNQSVMLGFLLNDRSDAPASYGEASHRIGNIGPYLGSVAGDFDWKTGLFWGDDDGQNPTNAPGDEGAAQLMGAAVESGNHYTAYNPIEGTYQLKMDVHLNNATSASVRGWLDLNNGMDFAGADEASAIETITQDGQTELSFASASQKPFLADVYNGLAQVDKIGMRVRTSHLEEDVQNPTGEALSGEVEDFQVRVIYPPKGSKETTTGLQGADQTATVTFTAFGQRDYLDELNSMDGSVAVQIVRPDGSLVPVGDDYVVPNEGTNTATASGIVTFSPEPGFTGEATGVALRAVDLNGLDSGWTSQITGLANVNHKVQIDGNYTMDALYVPTVEAVIPTAEMAETEGFQGVPQSGTVEFSPGDPSVPMAPGATFGNGETTMTVAGQGTYTVDENGVVTFTPEPDFIGTADSVKVIRKDVNGTPATGTYIPTVKAVTPTANDVTTIGVQGEVQSGTVTFVSGHPGVLMAEGAYLLDQDGMEVTSLTIDGEGTYTVDLYGKVTFTPEPDFVGQGTVLQVVRYDENGTKAVGTYQAEVTKKEMKPGTVVKKEKGPATGDSGNGLYLLLALISGAVLIGLKRHKA